jgi:hypothetical protein
VGFDTVNMLPVARFPMNDQKKRLLKAKIAVALLEELGRKPTEQEVERYWLAARVLFKAMLGMHVEQKAHRANGQLAIF